MPSQWGGPGQASRPPWAPTSPPRVPWSVWGRGALGTHPEPNGPAASGPLCEVLETPHPTAERGSEEAEVPALGPGPPTPGSDRSQGRPCAPYLGAVLLSRLCASVSEALLVSCGVCERGGLGNSTCPPSHQDTQTPTGGQRPGRGSTPASPGGPGPGLVTAAPLPLAELDTQQAAARPGGTRAERVTAAPCLPS